MTTAVLLAALTLCSARVSVVTAVKESAKATCYPGTGVQMTEVVNVGIVLIVCSGHMMLIPPPDNTKTAHVFVTPNPEPKNTAPISEVCPGATFAPRPDVEDVYDILIPQLPSNPLTFFLYCQDPNDNSSNQRKECFIGLNVAAYSRLGPNTCALPKSSIKFAVKKATEIVQFSCGSGKTLKPAGAGITYNESCREELGLPKGVTLVKTGENNYELKVQKVPAEPLTICYVCEGNNSKNELEICEVHIALGGSKGGATSLGATAHAAAVLGLGLAAFAFLQVR